MRRITEPSFPEGFGADTKKNARYRFCLEFKTNDFFATMSNFRENRKKPILWHHCVHTGTGEYSDFQDFQKVDQHCHPALGTKIQLLTLA